MSLITLNKLALPTGSVLQIVSSTKTDDFTMTGTTFADTGLSVSITPSSTSSKILISGHATLTTDSSASLGMLGLFRDSTQICLGDVSSTRPRILGGGYSGDTGLSVECTFYTIGINFLDTPNTTSAISYKVRLRGTGGSTISRLNKTISDRDGVDPRATSTLTAKEIKG